MIQIKIFIVGKALTSPALEYEKRLAPIAKIITHFAKDDLQLLKWLEKECDYFVLDENGKQLTSDAFAKTIANRSRLVFVIGGAEGLPAELKNHPQKISLSKMTFPHQMVRLILTEQLYRAFEILKGSPYHK